MDIVAETAELLAMNVRAMVTNRGAVTVTTAPGPRSNIVFSVAVDPKEMGKVIGKQGRTARSLRTLLRAIGHENGLRYSLDIDGVKQKLESDLFT